MEKERKKENKRRKERKPERGVSVEEKKEKESVERERFCLLSKIYGVRAVSFRQTVK